MLSKSEIFVAVAVAVDLWVTGIMLRCGQSVDGLWQLAVHSPSTDCPWRSAGYP